MTPKRIKKKNKVASTPTSRMEIPKVESPRPRPKMTEIVKDARSEIVKLNSVKLKKDMTEMYNEMKKRGIDGNSGTAGFMKNRAELDAFINKAEKDGLTNAQALARFKKQYKM